MMTLMDFKALDMHARAEAVWNGTYLDDRKEGGLTIQLFNLGTFYVEVFYDPLNNEIIRFEAFSSVGRLVLYLNTK